MYVYSIRQCKHEHEKGANTHSLVKNMGLCFMQLCLFIPTEEAQCQWRVRACRGESHQNIFFLKLMTFWCPFFSIFNCLSELKLAQGKKKKEL